ncbi:MAG: hypothetical protein ACTS4U_00640 [Candidatus Hodgkinia cicadicola]
MGLLQINVDFRLNVEGLSVCVECELATIDVAYVSIAVEGTFGRPLREFGSLETEGPRGDWMETLSLNLRGRKLNWRGKCT